jgi:hypothetical protein
METAWRTKGSAMTTQVLGSILVAFVLAGEPVRLAAPPPPQKPDRETSYDPIDQYVEQRLEGWKVLVNKRLLDKEHQDLREQTLKLLGDHLYRIVRVMPAEALVKLRRIPIWVELAHPRHPCMCYHVSANWLREHGMNPQKAGAVEIANARNFLSWTLQQPWMVLHELAHGYHHQVLGYDHAEIRACYEQAVASKSYESVLHVSGGKCRHYALTNDRDILPKRPRRTSAPTTSTPSFGPSSSSTIRDCTTSWKKSGACVNRARIGPEHAHSLAGKEIMTCTT